MQGRVYQEYVYNWRNMFFLSFFTTFSAIVHVLFSLLISAVPFQPFLHENYFVKRIDLSYYLYAQLLYPLIITKHGGDLIHQHDWDAIADWKNKSTVMAHQFLFVIACLEFAFANRTD